MEFKDFEKIKEIKEKYGITSINLRYIKDKTIVDSYGVGISFVLDDNYNIIDINSCKNVDEKYINNMNYSKLSYPLDNYSISDIINMSKDLEVRDNILGNNLKTSDRVIVYVKFLNLLVERYYDLSFHLQKLGYEVPSIKDYINTVIDRISETIISDLRLHKRPGTIEIMSSIGLKDDYILYYNYIKNIVDLYIENMGLKQSLSSLSNLEYNDNKDRVDVKMVAETVLQSYKNMKKEKENKKSFKLRTI